VAGYAAQAVTAPCARCTAHLLAVHGLLTALEHTDDQLGLTQGHMLTVYLAGYHTLAHTRMGAQATPTATASRVVRPAEASRGV
jgi:hypothetical protein